MIIIKALLVFVSIALTVIWIIKHDPTTVSDLREAVWIILFLALYFSVARILIVN